MRRFKEHVPERLHRHRPFRLSLPAIWWQGALRVTWAIAGTLFVAPAGDRLAGAQEGALFPVLPGPSALCHEEYRVFFTLRDGTFDYCKLGLRYVPGATACARSVARECAQWAATPGGLLSPIQTMTTETVRVVCPSGPVPPTCPSDMPEPD